MGRGFLMFPVFVDVNPFAVALALVVGCILGACLGIDPVWSVIRDLVVGRVLNGRYSLCRSCGAGWVFMPRVRVRFWKCKVSAWCPLCKSKVVSDVSIRDCL